MAPVTQWTATLASPAPIVPIDTSTIDHRFTLSAARCPRHFLLGGLGDSSRPAKTPATGVCELAAEAAASCARASDPLELVVVHVATLAEVEAVVLEPVAPPESRATIIMTGGPLTGVTVTGGAKPIGAPLAPFDCGNTFKGCTLDAPAAAATGVTVKPPTEFGILNAVDAVTAEPAPPDTTGVTVTPDTVVMETVVAAPAELFNAPGAWAALGGVMFPELLVH